MERLRRGRIASLTSKRELCASFVSLLLVVASGLSTYTLRVKETTGGHELVAIHVSQGDLVSVEYMHSVYNVKQREVFSIGLDSRFYLEKVMFGSYAAAHYYDAEPPQGFAFEGGLWIAKGSGKNYPVLKYRVAPSTGHVLHIGNQRLDLSNDSKTPGGLIEISLEREVSN